MDDIDKGDEARIWDRDVNAYTFTVGEYRNSIGEDGSILNPLFNRPYHTFLVSQKQKANKKEVTVERQIIQLSYWYLEKYREAQLETPDNIFDAYQKPEYSVRGEPTNQFSSNNIIPEDFEAELRKLWPDDGSTVTNMDLFMTLMEGIGLQIVSSWCFYCHFPSFICFFSPQNHVFHLNPLYSHTCTNLLLFPFFFPLPS